ncbi:MAG TPA: hypothetical protein ENJ53_01655 [Phaeodactylibacter sp.]|nr:hypothetical protein [Phaeodactylibacter sp.]
MHKELKKHSELALRCLNEGKAWKEVLSELNSNGASSTAVFVLLQKQFSFSADDADHMIQNSGLWKGERGTLVNDFFDVMIYWDSFEEE